MNYQMSSSNNPAKDEEFKSRLVEMLKEFGNCPNALAEFLVNNNAFRGSFVNKTCQSGNLGEAKPPRPPYFSDLEAMLEHQDAMLNKKPAEYIDMEGDVAESGAEREKRLYNQSIETLRNALSREDYDQATRVRDYMLLMKMDIPSNIF